MEDEGSLNATRHDRGVSTKKGGNRKERLQHKAMRTAALTHNTYIYRYRLHLTRQESGLIV